MCHCVYLVWKSIFLFFFKLLFDNLILFDTSCLIRIRDYYFLFTILDNSWFYRILCHFSCLLSHALTEQFCVMLLIQNSFPLICVLSLDVYSEAFVMIDKGTRTPCSVQAGSMWSVYNCTLKFSLCCNSA